MATLAFTQKERAAVLAKLNAERVLNDLALRRPSWMISPHENGQLQALCSTHTYRILIPGNGWGKQFQRDWPVLTPSGFRKIGDLLPGDQVIGKNGRATDVVGVFPQPVLDFYRITFHDGTTAECCGDHLWTVQMRENRFLRKEKPDDPRFGEWQTLRLRDILARVGPRPAYVQRPAIPMVDPVQFPSRPVPLDPYTLGVWLGNGSPSGRLHLHAEDEEIRQRVNGDRNRYFGTKNTMTFRVPGLIGKLHALGLAFKRSHEKTVPDLYLWNSEAVRRDLLAGLMDTDGSAMANKDEFSSTSEALADAVVFLVQSLGGRAVKSGPRQTTYPHQKETRIGRPSWRVNVMLPTCPYWSPRKASRWKPRETRINRLMVKIDRIADSDGVCIKVAAPDGLFVINDFLVTHNTTCMALDCDLLLQGTDPFKPEILPTHDLGTDAIWFCQKYAQWEIMRPKVEAILTPGWKWNSTYKHYTWPNRSRLFVLSSDSDWTAIQGVEIDMIYFDEHPDRKFWTEMMFRRRGKKKTRYMVAATMTQGLTWFVKMIIQPVEEVALQMGLTVSQRLRQQPHKTTFLWDTGGIADNPSMSIEDLEHYESIATAGEKELQVRLRGGYADFSGQRIFHQESLKQAYVHVEPGEHGALIWLPDERPEILGQLRAHRPRDEALHRFHGIFNRSAVEWRPGIEVAAGRITIWEPPDPHLAGNYVIGADFAAGLEGKDYDAAVVGVKKADGRVVQVAEALGHWGDVFFAETLFLLGLWYFEAFICGERQFGLPALRRLHDEMEYTYLYHSRDEASRNRRQSDIIGHHRHAADTIISNLQTAVRYQHLVIRSEEAHNQLTRYQWTPRNKTAHMEDVERSSELTMSAPSGENDDLVMAVAYMRHAAAEKIHYPAPQRDYGPGTYGHIMNVAEALNPRRTRSDPYAR